MFIPEDIRLNLHRRTEATLRVFPGSSWILGILSIVLWKMADGNLSVMNTPTLEHFHTLTPLTSVNHQIQTLRGYSNTVYKAVSAKDGRTYCLRRIHGRYLSTGKDKSSVANTYKIQIFGPRNSMRRSSSHSVKSGEGLETATSYRFIWPSRPPSLVTAP